MNGLCMLLTLLLVYISLWPQSFGHWIGSVKTGYAKRVAEVVIALEKQIDEHSVSGDK